MKKNIIAAVAGIVLGLFGLYWTGNLTPTTTLKVSSGVEIKLPETEPWQENMARGQLHDLFKNCQLFWQREGQGMPCTIEKVSVTPYYFSQTPGDRPEDEGFAPVTLLTGDERGFSAQSSHENSTVIWTINDEGKFKCSLGDHRVCKAITHLKREDVLAEVREYYGDVPDDVEYIEIK